MQTNELLIGWSGKDVTPYGKKVNLTGQFHMRITDKVKNPVTVTALAISSSDMPENSAVFVSCDTAVIPMYLVRECEDKIKLMLPDFPTEQLILNAIHGHAAPTIREGLFDFSNLSSEEAENFTYPKEYRDFLSDKIAEVAVESWQNRKKGAIAWGTDYVAAAHSRRAVYMTDFNPDAMPGLTIEKNARMYGKTDVPEFSHLEGYEDHTTQFLFTFDANKKLTGAVVNIACTAQICENNMQITADFWHDTRELLRKEYGSDLFILPQCAPAGDLSPCVLVNPKAEARALALKENVPLENLDYLTAKCREIGRKIKTAFDDTWKWAKKDIRENAAVRHTVKTLNISRRMVTEGEYKKNLKWIDELKTSGNPNKNSFIARCQVIIDRYHEQNSKPTFPIEIRTIKLGDIAFTTNPFELYQDFGMRIQARSPAEQTFNIQLCGNRAPMNLIDSNPATFPLRGGTYLPTKRAEQGGSYGASVYCNPVGHTGGQQIVDNTICELNKLFKDS
ncbi:MAG: hypothetical protein GY750_08685 [Lentisphaerae bacterium]|nr:hypothetical protein [Lentisphaerota bacterium]MCP4101486.1 hypothetical protein [Lentisphaerota bacterium]